MRALSRSRSRRKKRRTRWVSVQEATGFHLGIAMDLEGAARHAASLIKQRYDAWRDGGWKQDETDYKRAHFTIAVGGGNTLKAEYRAMLDMYAFEIDWITHVRFFFLEESSGEKRYESARKSLVENFIQPLMGRLIRRNGIKKISARLALEYPVQEQDIENALIARLTYPIDLWEVKQALDEGNNRLARKLASDESHRYQQVLREGLGSAIAFHLIICGISREGGIGALAPYASAVHSKKPGMALLQKGAGPIRLALNRGVFINAQCVSLIISGTRKLKALGRFEMEESTDFEQTVLETPLRMLRETPEIARKVYIFADERALHFDEGVFKYRDHGKHLEIKAEIREGQEEDGVHIFLLHGFMGLYSYINFLIRLPSAWTVSALHRGRYANKLPEEKIFPHYATTLRKAILRNWRNKLPTPTCYHSIAGVIADHLLLSVVEERGGPLPEFEALGKEDQQLIEALRVGGIIQLASWAPSDIRHVTQTAKSLIAHLLRREPLEYSGPSGIYALDSGDALKLNDEYEAMTNPLFVLNFLMKLPGATCGIGAMNSTWRFVLNKTDIQQKLSNREIPYALRLVGGRMLKKVSLYGLMKEVSAALHEPRECQHRHMEAMEVILKYDVPYLSIIHEDDFMVSVNRHRQECEYLLAKRLEKEGVEREEDLKVPVRLVVLKRETEEVQIDPLNPHLMLMSTTREGDKLSREVTAAVTRFVNENVAGAIKRGQTKPLPSVAKWVRAHRPPLLRRRKIA